MKVVGEANETIEHIPDGLPKVVAIALKSPALHRTFSLGWSD